MRVEGQFNESLTAGMGVRQGCITLPRLFNIFIDGCMREMRAKVGNVDARLRVSEVGWSVVACIFPEYTVLLTKCARKFQRVVDKFYSQPEKGAKSKCWEE